MYSEKYLKKLKESLEDSHRSNLILLGLVSVSLATIGLSTNSVSTIIGAMLLSPIGSIIVKSNLYSFLKNAGLRLEKKYGNWIFPLLTVIIFGLIVSFFLGKILQNIHNPFTDEKLTSNWPTDEMLSRADPLNAIYMILIALLCGIALPIAVYMKSSVGLVGIGIATALMPPIANIGLALSIDNGKDFSLDNLISKYTDESNYKIRAILTGALIFIINLLLLWLPSKLLLKEIAKKNNVFKQFEGFFNRFM